MVSLLCRDCPHWYGSEDDGYGPCTIKSQRLARRPLTYGGHACDEGYDLVAGAVMYVGEADVGEAAAPAPAKGAREPPGAGRARVRKPARPSGGKAARRPVAKPASKRARKPARKPVRKSARKPAPRRRTTPPRRPRARRKR